MRAYLRNEEICENATYLLDFSWPDSYAVPLVSLYTCSHIHCGAFYGLSLGENTPESDTSQFEIWARSGQIFAFPALGRCPRHPRAHQGTC